MGTPPLINTLFRVAFDLTIDPECCVCPSISQVTSSVLKVSLPVKWKESLAQKRDCNQLRAIPEYLFEYLHFAFGTFVNISHVIATELAHTTLAHLALTRMPCQLSLLIVSIRPYHAPRD